ncbi:hypothetical protein KDH_19480 [Dictyobacter sp. S3.2.2.5]|uniref:Uncharacterized protein n=1 Tax=Dictyobacter halimunensis TaxID=3026934 RepID=A0ABQ6FLF8_9CHLR|nr:hypothetical protein KDH_19480 [Dictyobacter sp. S3.2.2.5]
MGYNFYNTISLSYMYCAQEEPYGNANSAAQDFGSCVTVSQVDASFQGRAGATADRDSGRLCAGWDHRDDYHAGATG